MKFCNVYRNYWDVCIPTMLQSYNKTCKKLTGQNPFILFYGKEVVMPMEYIVPSLRNTAVTNMVDNDIKEE